MDPDHFVCELCANPMEWWVGNPERCNQCGCSELTPFGGNEKEARDYSDLILEEMSYK